MISHPPSFCGACLYFFIARRIQPLVPLVDDVKSNFGLPHESIVLHLLGMFYFIYLFIYLLWRKIPVRVTAPKFELTSQRQNVSRLPTEPPERPCL